MKKYFSIIIFIIIIITTVSCNRKDITKLTYSGKGTEWETKIEYSTKGNYKCTIKYLGNDKKPLDFKFKTEYISGNISSGTGQYSDICDKTGGMTIEMKNDDVVNGNIKKYGNKNNLYIEFCWDNKTEKINLKKETAL